MSSFKPLVVGDLHFKLSNLTDMLDLERRLTAEIERTQPTCLILLGDSLDSHETVYTPALNAFQSMVMRLSKKVQVFILIGNHDFINNSVFLTKEHPFNAMKLWSNVIIVDKPTWIFPKILACPYVPPGRFEEALNTIDGWRTAQVIFCHQEIRGAKMGPIESQKGDQWSHNLPFLISGHIHERHMVEDYCLYIGVPSDTAYGNNPERTISLFNINTEYLTFSEDTIDLGLPRKLTFDLTIAEAKEFVSPPNAYCRIHLHAKQSELLAFRKTKAGQKLWSSYKVIPKADDEVEIRSGLQRKSYLALLKETCEKEDVEVQNAFAEVTQSATNPK